MNLPFLTSQLDVCYPAGTFISIACMPGNISDLIQGPEIHIHNPSINLKEKPVCIYGKVALDYLLSDKKKKSDGAIKERSHTLRESELVIKASTSTIHTNPLSVHLPFMQVGALISR